MSTPRQKRLNRRLLQHHLPLAAASGIAFFLLYITRLPAQDPIFRTSFASGYVALVLLAVTLWIAPWNLLRKNRPPISIDLRRDIGIWVGIMGLIHTGFGLNVHLRGRPWLYFVYQKIEGPHLIPLRHDLFGFANYTGALATLVLIALFATSNDWSLRKLGTPRWKKLQRWNYVLFGLAIAHTAGFQAMEHMRPPFVATLVLCGAITLLMQGIGFQIRRSEAQLKAGAVTPN